MKKLLLSVLLAMVLCIPMFVMQEAQAVPIPLNLKATWAPNAEPDIFGYRIYQAQIDSPTTYNFWNGTQFNGNQCITPIDTTIEGTMLPLSPQQLLFTVSIFDAYPRTGNINFALKAFDTNLNMSPKATTIFVYNVDATPPAAPSGFTVVKQ